MASLTPDPKKRGYLLPPGCKDLIDVLKLGGSAGSPFSRTAESSNFKIQKGEARGGLDEIGKYVGMVFDSTALSFSLFVEPPGTDLTIHLSRMPGGIISADVWVQQDTDQETALREFMAVYHFSMPAPTLPWKGFFPGLPVYPTYDLMPVPVDAACLARRVNKLLRDVCDLTEHSSLLFRYNQVEVRHPGEGLS